MNKKLNEQISAVLPELKTALQNLDEEISIGGVIISRDDANNMYQSFVKYQDFGKKIPLEIVPLPLAIANIHYRAIQEELNSIYLGNDGR